MATGDFILAQSDQQVQDILNAVGGKADKTAVVTAMNGKITYTKATKTITINQTSL